MFQGSLPRSVQRIIHEQATGWDVPDVYVGCSGNFTIERTLSGGRWALHGNDVQIYTSTLGRVFAGDDPRLTIRDEYADRYGWLADYLDSPTRKAATILLCSRMLTGVDRTNAYYERMRGAYRDRWDALHAKTVGRVEQVRLSLASFYCGDVLDLLDVTPKDTSAFVSFPPFWTKGYEVMFEPLQKVFDWDEPRYEIFDDAGIERMLARVTEHRHWLLGTNVRRPEFEDRLVGHTLTTSRAVPIWLYGSGGPKRVVLPNQKVEPIPVRRLGPDDTLGERLTLAPLTAGQFNALRALYLNPAIPPAGATLALAVLCDGLLIGVCAYSLAPTGASWDEHVPEPHAYLVSDFPVTPTRYPRLSKLVIYAAASAEAKVLCERAMSRRYRSVVTTAFTSRPVSMKYRGVLRLMTRKDDETRPGGFALNYGAEFGTWTLAEGFETWRRKHSETR